MAGDIECHLFAQERPVRVPHGCQKNVKSEVKLHAVDEIRVCDVSLHDPIPIKREAAELSDHAIPRASEKNPIALRITPKQQSG
jgi:hypothetical protein